jgi:hypothetical protein
VRKMSAPGAGLLVMLLVGLGALVGRAAGVPEGGDLTSARTRMGDQHQRAHPPLALLGCNHGCVPEAFLAYLGVVGRFLRRVLVFWRMISLDLGAPISISTCHDFVALRRSVSSSCCGDL